MRKRHSLVTAAFMSFLLILPLVGSSMVMAQASPIERLVSMEQVLFGSIPEGAVVNRLEIVERLVFGQAGSGTLPERLEQCWNYVQGDRAGGMNLKFKLKTVQWSVFGSIVDGPIVPVLDDAEARIMGRSGSGSIGARLDTLLGMTIPGGKPSVDYTLLAKGTLVRLRITTALSSAKSRPGDQIRMIVVDDVIADGKLVLPKGSAVVARVLDNVRPTKMGVKARVDLEIQPIEGIDSTPIVLGVDAASIAANTSVTLAPGEGVRRFAVLGKEGTLGGLLSQNPELELAADVEVFLTVMQSTKVLGLVAGR